MTNEPEALQAIAAAELAAAGCVYVELLTPHVVERLRMDPATGAVTVTDDGGSALRGWTPQHLVRAMRAEHEAKHPARYFR